jgi:hypothetical protein
MNLFPSFSRKETGLRQHVHKVNKIKDWIVRATANHKHGVTMTSIIGSSHQLDVEHFQLNPNGRPILIPQDRQGDSTHALLQS